MILMHKSILLYGVIIIVTTKTEPKFPFGVVLGVSCGGLLLFGIIIIYLVRRCQRRKKVKQRRFWDQMPRDVLYPGEEKFELEDKKEGIGRYGEVTISSIEARFEGLGFTNEAARHEDVGISNDKSQSEEMRISGDDVYHDEMGILNKAMQ